MPRGLSSEELPPRREIIPEADRGTVRIPMASTPIALRGGVRLVSRAKDAPLVLAVRWTEDRDRWNNDAHELLFDVRELEGLPESFNNRTRITLEVRLDRALLADHARPNRARIVLEDADGKRLHLPNRNLTDAPSETDGWVTLEGYPTVDLPVPLGLAEEGFDPARVVAVGLSLEPGFREGKITEGRVEVRKPAIETFEPIVPRVLEPTPEILAEEGERRKRMEARMASRLGTSKGLAVGVNLPHPGVRSPEGEVLQLYGTYLEAREAWYGEYFDLRNEKVERALRADFRDIRAIFGPRAIVRVFLFNDLRTGIEFDDEGTPVRISDRARENVANLLRIAARERIVLIPVLTDFLVADGQDRAGPEGTWAMGEHPEIIVDAEKRAAFFALMEELVRAHADHPAVLAWDVMNEPENAVAVVTPARFAELQVFLREGVEAIHRAGELATVGHRSPVEAARYMRGRIASDLGQAHYYPHVETRESGYDLATTMEPAFGEVPSGWGEAPVREGRVERDLREARAAGARYLLYWSYRGDDDSADGFAVRAHRQEIIRALRRR